MVEQNPQAASQITITLQLQEWNQLLAVLSDAPYRVVAPLIMQIANQAQSQQQAPMVPNGADNRLAS